MRRTTATATALAVSLGATLALAGCGIGAHSNDEILAESHRRGSGAEPFLIREAEAAVAARVSAEPGSLVIASLTLEPRGLGLVAADPRTPGNWDSYRYSGGSPLAESTPVRAAPGELDGFRLADFRALERLPELVADARQRVGSAPDARLARMSIEPPKRARGDDAQPTGPELEVVFTDPRHGTTLQRYDADGRLL
ncbi:hypothetical protein WCE34_13505 [Luteimonas sp. MJ204]|uniref:hypothetical protein n=1 Tax=Luteimonas sp. MJ145 TaxID=3129234 RepID=UPI0031BAD139